MSFAVLGEGKKGRGFLGVLNVSFVGKLFLLFYHPNADVGQKHFEVFLNIYFFKFSNNVDECRYIVEVFLNIYFF